MLATASDQDENVSKKRQRLNEDVLGEDDVVTIRIPKAHLAAFRANKEEATGTVAN